MLAYLFGKLTEKSPTEAVLDVGGVGFSANISATTFAELPPLDAELKLFTYLHVREDALLLFGFTTIEERALFKLLLSISGVGPKLAQTILSGMTAGELRQTILANNLNALTSISGIGKKTAERIILELRDKITKLDLKPSMTMDVHSDLQQARSDAYSALVSLGFTKASAEKAMRAAIADAPNAKADELIRISLRQIQAEK
jgi:holliday junction DNA helicase RuvA